MDVSVKAKTPDARQRLLEAYFDRVSEAVGHADFCASVVLYRVADKRAKLRILWRED